MENGKLKIEKGEEPPLLWTREESAEANYRWRAACGPHAIGAACGMTLEKVKWHLPGYRGWMNPTMMEAALRSIGVKFAVTKGLRSRVLFSGVHRLQWEGPWLEAGRGEVLNPKRVAEAYRHTHWVTHFDGWVLCTVACASEWVPVEDWMAFLEQRGSPWHVTHHYAMGRPDGTHRTNGTDAPYTRGSDHWVESYDD